LGHKFFLSGIFFLIMKIEFNKIDDDVAREKLGSLYYQNGYFYKIVCNDVEIGITGYCKIQENFCNINYFIYPEFRNKQTKGLLLAVIYFPRKLNFTGCLILTTLKKLQKVLNRMKKYGVVFKGLVENYSCFLINYERR